MASEGDKQREKKLHRLEAKYASKRKELKEIRDNKTLPISQRMKAALELDGLPKNSARVRQRNRCAVTGNPRSYFREFGISRHVIRELLSQGMIPGVGHASW